MKETNDGWLSWIRDILTLLGLGLFGYGLWGVDPRLSFVSCGAILLYIGLFWGRKGA